MSGCAFWISASGPPIMPFAKRAVNGGRKQLGAGPQRRHDIVEHRLEDRRHAGHDMDVADAEARRDRDRIVDVVGAARHARHALARLVELDAARWRSSSASSAIRLRVVVAGHAERLGDGIRGDVVMRRADAAGGEDIVVAVRAAH